MSPEAADAAQLGGFAATLEMIGAALRVDSSDARLLRTHDSSIYLLPREDAVVRIVEATEENRTRAGVSVTVTAWLVQVGFPSVEPLCPHPVETGGMIATLWRYLPQPDRVDRLPLAALGQLLRELHGLPPPPFPVPPVDPLGRLRRAVALDDERREPVLSAGQRKWLDQRMREDSSAYSALTFPLGEGLIHNDAHVGNVLVAKSQPSGYVLADWDGVCRGPREIDLVQEGAPGNRFGLTEEQRREFSDAYGYDLASWPGWPVLRELRDLHSLAGHLRVSPVKPASRAELENRLRILRAGTHDRWHGVA
jgi:hypothetical protein